MITRISEVVPGLAAHQSGGLHVGDVVLAVDSHPVDQLELSHVRCPSICSQRLHPATSLPVIQLVLEDEGVTEMIFTRMCWQIL